LVKLACWPKSDPEDTLPADSVIHNLESSFEKSAPGTNAARDMISTAGPVRNQYKMHEPSVLIWANWDNRT
jgi:hypothetical protein